MKLLLKRFQEDAVSRLVRHLHMAAKDSLSGDRQSVCLASPTGSGKTVMLTRAIEIILQGDDEYRPMPYGTFLWITDQPELNVQTRKKMLATSTVLNRETLVVLDASYDHDTLQPGTVNFINIQKLGKGMPLVSVGDRRTFLFWETIRKTVAARPGKFFVIIDEAHRGMTEGRELAEAATIIQKFIKGSTGEIEPMPVIVGISATPERFQKLITGTGRTSRSVDIEAADVRASGLLKEVIVLYHPKREQPTDMTMLREAARSLQKFTKNWGEHCAQNEAHTVHPLMVVQVEDSAAKGQISETDLEQALRVLRETLGNLSNAAFAHAFQEGSSIKLGSEELRYLAPSEINDDENARVVFFKTSLNTGWDCPRAEVMMSFRSAVDATSIAQLVGRMVRTPLARSIADNEVLNSVPLYLPHYDAKALEKVINKLSKPDADNMPPVDFEMGDNVVELSKAPGSEKLFAALAALPSYIVPRKRKSSQIRRLMTLARLLTHDQINEDADTEAKQEMINVLNAEFKRVRKTARFQEILEKRSLIDVDAVNWEVGTETTKAGDSISIDLSTENVDDLFEAIGRRLTEGLHKIWWRERAKALDTLARQRAKLELFAMCIEPDVIKKLERQAQTLVQKWLRQHYAPIAALPEESRTRYDDVRNLAATPELVPLVYPAIIQSTKTGRDWQKHLYVDAGGTSRVKLNTPEQEIIEEEIGRKDVVGWLRNTDRKPWAICIPYDREGEDRPMYPDFLVLRKIDKRIAVDIVDPHQINLADAPHKASGLAKFAAMHADRFERIELILLDDRTVKRLDLIDEAVRAKVKGVSTTAELRKLFDET